MLIETTTITTTTKQCKYGTLLRFCCFLFSGPALVARSDRVRGLLSNCRNFLPSRSFSALSLIGIGPLRALFAQIPRIFAQKSTRACVDLPSSAFYGNQICLAFSQRQKRENVCGYGTVSHYGLTNHLQMQKGRRISSITVPTETATRAVR